MDYTHSRLSQVHKRASSANDLRRTRFACLRLLYAALIVLAYFHSAHAFLPIDPGGGGGGNPGGTPGSKCLENTVFQLNASPLVIDPGGSSTVSWSIRPPRGCTLFDRVMFEGQFYGLSGSVVVQPTATTNYPLTLIIPGGFKPLGPVTVTVTLPPTVYINGSTPEWRRVLIQALGEANKKVILAPHVDMDLSGYHAIRIADNVTLTSEIPALNQLVAAGFPDVTPRVLARDARNLGPRLFMNTRPDYLFEIAGDNVKLTGFRLQGPDFNPSDGEARGIVINSRKRVEISHMEFSGWSLVAIYIKDPGFRIHSAYPTRIRDNPDAVRIHDNFFHHNQHTPGGNGYGIEVKEAAQAIIERNVFDFNRHAIASGSEPGTGYVAQQNLVLEGGGVHCINNTAGLVCGHTHQFDVHGSDNCVPFRFLDDKWNCGSAGEEYHFTANAFQYTKDHAIDIRGYPSIAAVVSDNVFAHGQVSDAVRQRLDNRPVGGVLMQVEANIPGVNSHGDFGVCDFDGDGVDDLFLATGVSWWYMSGARMHWTFLNSQRERLQDVKLGDFDGDRRCDVFTVHAGNGDLSSGGTDVWRFFGIAGVPFEELQVGDFNGDGIKDFFRRARDGQWWAISPGHYGWIALQSSGFPLSELRFGDFDNDRITDVIAVQGGHWSVSWARQIDLAAAQRSRQQSAVRVDRRYRPQRRGRYCALSCDQCRACGVGGIVGRAQRLEHTWEAQLARKPRVPRSRWQRAWVRRALSRGRRRGLVEHRLHPQGTCLRQRRKGLHESRALRLLIRPYACATQRTRISR